MTEFEKKYISHTLSHKNEISDYKGNRLLRSPIDYHIPLCVLLVYCGCASSEAHLRPCVRYQSLLVSYSSCEVAYRGLEPKKVVECLSSST